jgi:AAA family ATPase
MVLEGVTINKLRRTYKVVSVNARDNSLAKVKLDSTAIRILQQGEEDRSTASGPGTAESRGDLALKNVPGLGTQVKAINAFLRGFTSPFYFPDIESSRSCGFVIHGGHGTGKTFILHRIADTNWGKVHWIKPFDKLTTVRELFKQALTQQPCMILIDDLEELIAQDRSNRDALIETIGSELDVLADKAREQNALPHVLVLVTCSDYLTDVPQKLQSRSRLFKNITLPIPRAPQRLEILRYHDPPLAPQEKEACLVDLSQRTHAYNCKDLSDLVRNARDIREDIISEAGVDTATEGSEQQHFVTREDIEQALRLTRPTAMHDINLQPPIVHWQDVGGQDSVKKVLSRMIKYAKVRLSQPTPPPAPFCPSHLADSHLLGDRPVRPPRHHPVQGPTPLWPARLL